MKSLNQNNKLNIIGEINFQIYDIIKGNNLKRFKNSMLNKCKFSSKMLTNLINDMMDLAKSEQMKFTLNNQLFDM